MASSLLKQLKHHQGIAIVQRRVLKRLWQATDDFESELLPEAHGAIVC
jgi:hypothetical protein